MRFRALESTQINIENIVIRQMPPIVGYDHPHLRVQIAGLPEGCVVSMLPSGNLDIRTLEGDMWLFTIDVYCENMSDIRIKRSWGLCSMNRSSSGRSRVLTLIYVG